MLGKIEMNTSSRILIAFAAVIALVLVLPATSYYAAAKLGAIVEDSSTKRLPTNSLLWNVRQSETAVRANAGALTETFLDHAAREEAKKRVLDAAKRVDEGAARYQASPKSAEAGALWEKFTVLYGPWKSAVARLREAVEERGRATEAPAARQAELDREVDQAYDDLNAIGTPVMPPRGT